MWMGMNDYMRIGHVLALVGLSLANSTITTFTHINQSDNKSNSNLWEREQVQFTSIYMSQAFTCDYTKWVMHMWLHANWTCSRSRRLESSIRLQHRLSLTSIKAIEQVQFTSVYVTQAFTCGYTKGVRHIWLIVDWTRSRSRRLKSYITLK